MPDFFQDVPYMAMLAVTIGPELEHFANVIGTGGDAAGQVILDSIGSLAVEMAADDLEGLDGPPASLGAGLPERGPA